MKKLPEALSVFELIRTRNLAYVDKTRFIKEYEDLEVYAALLLRPCRFGKTLFTEILSYYYDKASQELADALFKPKIEKVLGTHTISGDDVYS